MPKSDWTEGEGDSLADIEKLAELIRRDAGQQPNILFVSSRAAAVRMGIGLNNLPDGLKIIYLDDD